MGSKQNQEQNLLTNLFRSFKKRLTDWRMSLLLSRRSSKQSLKSWNKHLLKCLDINHSNFDTNSYCIFYVNVIIYLKAIYARSTSSSFLYNVQVSNSCKKMKLN